jgi:hypothetical protein
MNLQVLKKGSAPWVMIYCCDEMLLHPTLIHYKNGKVYTYSSGVYFFLNSLANFYVSIALMFIHWRHNSAT